VIDLFLDEESGASPTHRLHRQAVSLQSRPLSQEQYDIILL